MSSWILRHGRALITLELSTALLNLSVGLRRVTAAWKNRQRMNAARGGD